MQGFPIGAFLFWELSDKKAIENYLFYEFVDHYHQNKTRNFFKFSTSVSNRR